MVFIGIDPGVSGSFAFLSDDEKILGVCDVPTIKTVGGKTPRVIRASAPRLTLPRSSCCSRTTCPMRR